MPARADGGDQSGSARDADSSRRMATSLVIAQFSALLVQLLYPVARGRWIPLQVGGWVLAVGGVILVLAAAPSLGRALTVSPIPKPGAGLVATGLYGWVRHPMYTGVLLLGAGLALRGQTLVHVVAWLVLVAVLVAKVRFEEARLTQLHPQYQEYARRVGALVPRLSRLARRDSRL